jgi:hypothetical protein
MSEGITWLAKRLGTGLPPDASARRLLKGFAGKDRRGSTRFFKAMSPEELQARRALAGLLRAGRVDADILRSLADLFDPQPWHNRTVRFASRRQGPKKDFARDNRILEFVRAQLKAGAKMSRAVTKAANEFALSERMIRKIQAEDRRMKKHLSSGHRLIDFDW